MITVFVPVLMQGKFERIFLIFSIYNCCISLLKIPEIFLLRPVNCFRFHTFSGRRSLSVLSPSETAPEKSDKTAYYLNDNSM